MIFVDYEFYHEHYLGDVLDEAEFLKLMPRAVAKIKQYLSCEPDEELVTDEMKFAVCEVCEIIHSASEHSGIDYERNDGYWVSYEDESRLNEKIHSSVRVWFCDSGLLYRGRDF